MEICNAIVNYNNDNSVSDSYPFVFKQHEIRVDIETPESITIVEEITIENRETIPLSHIDFLLDQSFSNLTVEDRIGTIDYFPLNFLGLLRISFRYDIGINQTYYFKLSYNLETELDFTAGKPSYYLFSFNSYINYFTELQIVTIRLPSNTFLHADEHGPPPYLPVNATEDPTGNRIYLTWKFENLEQDTEINFIVFFDEPYSQPISNWIIAVILVVGLIAGAFSVFWIMRMRAKRVKKEIGKIYLTDDQNIILKLVNENEGRISQKELLEETKYTKSKISRNLTALEKQGLITKEKWGREFRVYLTKEGRRVVE